MSRFHDAAGFARHQSMRGRGEIRSRLIAGQLASILGGEDIGSLLDVGCGGGRTALYVARALSVPTLACVDPLEEMLDQARSLIGDRPGTSFHRSTDTGRAAPYGLVLSHGVLGWTEDPAQHIREIVQLSGRFVSILYGNARGHLLQALRDGRWTTARELLDGDPWISSSSQAGSRHRVFDHADVEEMLRASGASPIRTFGVRLATDLHPDDMAPGLDEVVALESDIGASAFFDLTVMLHTVGVVHERT